MKIGRWVIATIVALVSFPAFAQDKSKTAAELGEALAIKLCANCHVLPGGNPSAVPAGIPTFRAIANKPGQTGDHITQVLMQPHAPMPDLQMTRQEILEILAYLETLRTDNAVKPIAPPADTPLPSTPRKS